MRCVFWYHSMRGQHRISQSPHCRSQVKFGDKTLRLRGVCHLISCIVGDILRDMLLHIKWRWVKGTVPIEPATVAQIHVAQPHLLLWWSSAAQHWLHQTSWAFYNVDVIEQEWKVFKSFCCWLNPFILLYYNVSTRLGQCKSNKRWSSSSSPKLANDLGTWN